MVTNLTNSFAIVTRLFKTSSLTGVPLVASTMSLALLVMSCYFLCQTFHGFQHFRRDLFCCDYFLLFQHDGAVKCRGFTKAFLVPVEDVGVSGFPLDFAWGDLRIERFIVVDVEGDVFEDASYLPEEVKGSVLPLGVDYQVTIIDMIALGI